MPTLLARLDRQLDALDGAVTPDAMNIPGFNFYKLRGKPVCYTVHVNGPWCVTFEWDREDALAVDLENYH